MEQEAARRRLHEENQATFFIFFLQLHEENWVMTDLQNDDSDVASVIRR